MKKKFSLSSCEENLELEKKIELLSECVRVTLGPSGRNCLFSDKKQDVTFLKSGASLIKSLDFSSESKTNTFSPNNFSSTIGKSLFKLFEQAALKTEKVSGDGSTTTLLFCCELLQTSLKFVNAGYNSIFLSNGLKKLSYFFSSRILDFSHPLSTNLERKGLIRTLVGKKTSIETKDLLDQAIEKIERDGFFFVEENSIPKNENEKTQGIELDRGFLSSYFINDVKNFQAVYENCYVLISTRPISVLSQLEEIIEYIQLNNSPLIIIAEEISKEIVSTLVLNTIKKKIKVVVIKYTAIKFIKTGILEDLALLTHANYSSVSIDTIAPVFTVQDLGFAEKVIVKKEKSTFLISKFAKLVATRRIFELNQELLQSESEYEKTICKTRIARLSGNIVKIKIGETLSSSIEEMKKQLEKLLQTLAVSLEEGILPGGGASYLYLREEIVQWGNLNLIGEEIFAAHILSSVLLRPFIELCLNGNISPFLLLQKIEERGYPFCYDLLQNKIGNGFEKGVIDSTKVIRTILWNSITMIATLITSE